MDRLAQDCYHIRLRRRAKAAPAQNMEKSVGRARVLQDSTKERRSHKKQHVGINQSLNDMTEVCGGASLLGGWQAHRRTRRLAFALSTGQTSRINIISTTYTTSGGSVRLRRA